MSFNWDNCIICQETKADALKCPLNDPRHLANGSDVYATFLNNVKELRSIDALPCQLQLDEDTIVDDLIQNRASWHKLCNLKFTNSKVIRAKEAIERRKRANEPEAEPEEVKKGTSKRKKTSNSIWNCIFCTTDSNDKLHNFTTLEADRSLRQIASEVGDFELLSRISGGDLVAIEAKYHLSCLTSFRNNYRSFLSKKSKISETDDEKINECRAFIELVNFIEKSVEEGTQFFKLSELHSLFEGRLKDLGVTKTVNKTRLKKALLEHLEDAQEQHDGKNMVFVFKEGMRNILKEALKTRDFSDDAAVLAKAATIVRDDLFAHKGFNFSGCFQIECQQNSVPSSLKSLVAMILNGLNLKEQEKNESQACLTICQTIMFNTKKRTYSSKTSETRHSLLREPPLPLYLGLNIHAMTRSKTLVTKLFQMGISVSYDRIREIEDWLATSVSERFKEDGCVTPACLRKGIFSVGALDNIDHNPSSTTSASSFHGTGISIFQFPTKEVLGQEREPLTIPPTGTEQHALPDEYCIVPPTELKTNTVSVPERQMTTVQATLTDAITQEDRWVTHAMSKLSKDPVDAEDTITWAAYHSSLQPPPNEPHAITSLLPLFYEKAATPAMVKHGMDVLRQSITFLNPGQIPVMAVDQPLFALAKLVQWRYPTTHGENNYVVMFGGLHMEMALWNTLGDLLEKSGWTTALADADVASSGTADAFLKVSHLTRTRYAVNSYNHIPL